MAFISGKQEQQWTQPVNREELPELSVFMTRAHTVCTLWAFALFSLVLPSVKSDYHCNPIEVQRSSTTEAEQYLGVMPSSKASCCRKFPQHCERFSFFLIKRGNDGRMLWAAAVPVMLLLSGASSHSPQLTPLPSKGSLQGHAARAGCSSGGVWLPTVGQATASSKLAVLRRGKFIINVFLFFFFLSCSRKQFMKMQMLW